MESTFIHTFSERLLRITSEIELLQAETNEQPLQVGDRTLIDRSLEVMRSEAARLLQFAADSQLDPTKQ